MSDAVKDYLNNIAKQPLLTPEQEIQLGRRVMQWRKLKELDRPLTPQEQREYRSGERARQQFIKANLQLVVHVARKYEKRNRQTLEFMDLVQEGNIGLSRAVELFDYSRGYKFSTYAFWWIKQAINRALHYTDPIIRLPSNVHDMLFKINRIAQDLSQQLGRTPKISEIAEVVEMKPKELSNMLKSAYRVTSLDRLASSHDSGNAIVDMIPDPCSIEEDLDTWKIQVMLSYMDQYVDTITKHIIVSRYASEPVKWSELQKQTGLCRESMQRKQRHGLSRLRMMLADPLRDTPLGGVKSSSNPTEPWGGLYESQGGQIL